MEQNAKKSALKVNAEKKIITIDDAIPQTAADKIDLNLYISNGYIVKHKSAARAKEATERADKYTSKEIEEALASDKEALAEYNKIKNGKGKGCGFFAAKEYFKKWLKKKKEEEKKEDK